MVPNMRTSGCPIWTGKLKPIKESKMSDKYVDEICKKADKQFADGSTINWVDIINKKRKTKMKLLDIIHSVEYEGKYYDRISNKNGVGWFEERAGYSYNVISRKKEKELEEEFQKMFDNYEFDLEPKSVKVIKGKIKKGKIKLEIDLDEIPKKDINIK